MHVLLIKMKKETYSLIQKSLCIGENCKCITFTGDVIFFFRVIPNIKSYLGATCDKKNEEMMHL